MVTYLSCSDFHRVGVGSNSCCGSCHAEDEAGCLPFSEHYPKAKDGAWKDDDSVVIELCCGMREVLFWNASVGDLDLDRDLVARVIRAKREV